MRHLTPLFFVLCFICSQKLTAQSHTFTDANGDGNWHNPDNWNAGTVPSANSTVLIQDGFQVTITAQPAQAQFITLQGASELEVNNTLTLSSGMDISLIGVLHFKQGTISGGAINNEGLILCTTSTPKTFSNTTIENEGRIEIIETGAIDLANTTTINNNVESTIEIKGISNISQENGVGVINNFGTVLKTSLEGSSGFSYMVFEFNNYGTITIDEGETFLFLTPQALLNNTPQGTIEGNGTFDITGTFINEGSISPGGEFEVGTLTFVNTFSLDGGELILDIIDENTHDLIEVVGDAQVSGTVLLHSENLEAANEGFFTVTPLITTQGVEICDLPNEVTANNGGGIIMSYNVLCEPNSVLFELYEAFIFSVDEALLKKSFSLFPNPSSGDTTFTLDNSLLSDENSDIIITNVQGQKVLEISELKERNTFPKGNLKSGVYFVSLVIEEKIIATKKLLLL